MPFRRHFLFLENLFVIKAGIKDRTRYKSTIEADEILIKGLRKIRA